jgi:hypothetical protein
MMTNKPVSKLAKARTQNKKKKVIGLILLVGVLITAYVLLMRSSVFRITKVNITGLQEQQEKHVRASLETYLNKSSLLLLPNRNIFIFSETVVKKSTLNQNTFLEYVEFERKGLHTLEVSSKVRAPQFAVRDTITNEITAYIDSAGAVFVDASAALGTTTVSVYTASVASSTESKIQNNSFKSTIGSKLDNQYMTNLMKYITELRTRGYTIYRIDQKTQSDVEIAITESGGVLRVAVLSDPDITLATYFAAKRAEPLKSLIANKISQLQYIDLRFGNKVFYKFRE